MIKFFNMIKHVTRYKCVSKTKKINDCFERQVIKLKKIIKKLKKIVEKTKNMIKKYLNKDNY